MQGASLRARARDVRVITEAELCRAPLFPAARQQLAAGAGIPHDPVLLL